LGDDIRTDGVGGHRWFGRRCGAVADPAAVSAGDLAPAVEAWLGARDSDDVPAAAPWVWSVAVEVGRDGASGSPGAVT